MKQDLNIINNEHLKQNPFQVPEDYFETNRMKLEEKILCSSSNPFTTPEDYFETNKICLYEKILTNNQPSNYSVPENYFEKNKELIYQKIISTQTTTQHHKKNIIQLFQYASAAAVIIGIVWGIRTIYQPSNNNIAPVKDCKTIACLTKKDILSREILDDELLQETISDEQIEKHFNTNSNKNFPDTNTHSTSELNEVF